MWKVKSVTSRLSSLAVASQAPARAVGTGVSVSPGSGKRRPPGDRRRSELWWEKAVRNRSRKPSAGGSVAPLPAAPGPVVGRVGRLLAKRDQKLLDHPRGSSGHAM